MKKNILCTLAVTLVCSITFSQNPTSIRDSINYVFATLDTAYIPSGIIYEKASPSLDWANFRAVNDSATNISIWKGMYKVLRNGSVSANSNFLSDDSLANLFIQAREDNVVPLCILYYNYEQLKPHVLDSNLLSVSGKQLFDVPGRNESPYTQHSVFNACAAFNVAYGASAQFALDSSFYFSNDTTGITKTEIDFSDGAGFRVLNWGDTVNIVYPDSSLYLISIRIVKNNGDTLFSSTYFKIVAAACHDEYPHDIIAKITGTIPYPEGPVYPTAIASAKYTVTYGYEADGITKHTCIKKPVMFVSGFDPGYQDYHTTFDDCKYGRLGWIDIICGKNHDLEEGTVEPWDPEFLEGPEFFNDLFALGYDIIFVDFKDGTDYMQRNAFVLVEMINWINANKCTDEEITIIGASMGGQLVRYALTYMEKNNMPHCAKLNINFDSPAQGANTPFGLQKFVEFGDDVFPDFLEAADAFDYQIAVLKSPAAKQLLVPHFEGDPLNNMCHDLRIDFEQELYTLNENGYPDEVPTIAIANGNKVGATQSFIGEGQKFLDLYYNFLLVSVYAESFFLPGSPEPIGVIPIPAGCEFWGSWSIFLVPITFLHLGFAPETLPHYDTAPGSQQTKLQDQLTADYNDLWILSAFDVSADNFCFVPTISALDVNTEDLEFNIESVIIDDAPSIWYPFQSYYAPFPASSSNNENHVQLATADIIAGNEGNTSWAINKIEQYEYMLSSPLPEATLGSTFNFGNKYRNKLNSLDINSTGLLQINGNYNTDYGDGDPANAPSTFTVTTSECNPSLITINSGGILEIGDDNDPYDNNKGILEILEGSEIHVKNGGILKIRKNSQLNLRSGATLYLEAGGKIEIEEVGFLLVDNGAQLKLNGGVIDLLDNNAKLKLYAGGEIVVGAGVDFKLDSEGFFEYYQDGIFTMEGTTSKFILEGDGENDLKMRLQSNADFFIETHDVEINNCKLSFNDEALFQVSENNTSLSLVNYEDFSSSIQAKSAILANNVVSLDVNNCDFTGFSNPVKVEDVSVCPDDVNVNIQFSTFTGMGNLAITATNVDRIYMNGNTITGSASALGGVWLEDVTDATIDNGTIQGFSGSTDAGVFLWNTARLVLDAAVIKNNKYGVDMHASSIYLRNKATIKNNYTGIYAFGGIDYGTTNPTNTMKKISVGDVGCGWIINNTSYGIKSLDMQLEIDQIIHDNNDDDPGNSIPNRFDGNLYGIQACYDYYDADDLGGTEIMAEHNHWKTGAGPAIGYLQAGFDEDTHPCTSMNFSTTCYIETKPTNCACNYNDCEETDCAEELTEEEITLRLAATSCNSTIPKPGGGGTITVGAQFRVAYLKYLDGDYNYAYQSFLYLKNKVNQNYPQGLTKGVCNTLYREAVMYVELCSLLATVHCQQPFYTGRLADEFSDTEFNIELYPNPTNKEFTLFTDNAEIIEFKIMDITGREIITNSFQTNTNISVVGWLSGIYLVYLKGENSGLITTLKVMVE